MPGPGGLTHRSARIAEQRERILLAARDLFAERGPDAVTVADVAEAAGVARATVFNHFGSKHALLEGITAQVLHGYEALLQNALAADDVPVPTLVHAIFDRMGAGIEDERRFHRAVFREIAKITLGLDEGGAGQVSRQRALTLLEKLLARGQDRGELSREHRCDDLATAFDSLVFGTVTHWLYDDVSEPLHDRMLRAARVFLEPIAPGHAGPDEVLPALDGPVRPRARPGGARGARARAMSKALTRPAPGGGARRRPRRSTR